MQFRAASALLEAVGQHSSQTKLGGLGGQQRGQAKNQCAVAFELEVVGEQGSEAVRQRGVAVEIQRVLVWLRGFPVDAEVLPLWLWVVR